jgi:hypothetical protein
MPIDTTNLMQEIYDLFSNIYAKSSSKDAFLAFEVLGIPVSEGMFKLDASDNNMSQPLAVERLSEMTNQIAHIQDNSVTRGLGTVDGTIELVLDASVPVNADAMTSLGAVKRNASTEFDITLGSMDGVPNHRFHPVSASPTDWYVPTANANWTAHSSGQPQTQPPPAKTPPPKPLPPPVWRVVPAQFQPVLSQPVSVAHPLLSTATFTRAAVVKPQPLAASRVAFAAAPTSAASPVLTRTQVAASPAATQLSKASQLTVAVANLSAVTTAQPVASNSLDIRFDHCVVTLNRPWFPDTMLLMRNWYLPGYSQGEICNGTGAHDPGILPVVTTGFVAIRNLSITANWSQQDLSAIQSSASLGPFSLIGRSFNTTTGTLSCSGMQVIGWFCSALPVLPPLPDPAKP